MLALAAMTTETMKRELVITSVVSAYWFDFFAKDIYGSPFFLLFNIIVG
jgi:hypothetical protein